MQNTQTSSRHGIPRSSNAETKYFNTHWRYLESGNSTSQNLPKTNRITSTRENPMGGISGVSVGDMALQTKISWTIRPDPRVDWSVCSSSSAIVFKSLSIAETNPTSSQSLSVAVLRFAIHLVCDRHGKPFIGAFGSFFQHSPRLWKAFHRPLKGL